MDLQTLLSASSPTTLEAPNEETTVTRTRSIVELPDTRCAAAGALGGTHVRCRVPGGRHQCDRAHALGPALCSRAIGGPLPWHSTAGTQGCCRDLFSARPRVDRVPYPCFRRA